MSQQHIESTSDQDLHVVTNFYRIFKMDQDMSVLFEIDFGIKFCDRVIRNM